MCYFLSQKVYGKIIFTDYWKNLVLNFSMMGNTVFFESTSWWKRWFILITEKLSETLVFNFSVVWNTVFFWVRKFMERWYLLVKQKFLFWTFWWWEIRSFLQPKIRWKDDIYLGFLCFPWYSGTWEIRFLMQWNIASTHEGWKNWKLWYTIVFVCLVCWDFLVHVRTTKIKKRVPRTVVDNTFYRRSKPNQVPQMNLYYL